MNTDSCITLKFAAEELVTALKALNRLESTRPRNEAGFCVASTLARIYEVMINECDEGGGG